MTKRLFDSDPTLVGVRSKVISCTPKDGKYAVVLNSTIFYPRGGGQPCESGTIGGIPVVDVYEQDGEILHITEQPVGTGSVECEISAQMRIDSMQQHSGQHVLSAVIEKLYGIPSIIARIEPEYCHLELPQPLSHEQLREVTEQVQAVIERDLKISTRYFSREQAQRMEIRGNIPEHEKLRVVKIEELDRNCCGGTHCASTGEIGDFLVCGEKNVRGNYRVYYVCGERVRKEQQKRTAMLLQAQNEQSCENIGELFDKIGKSLERKKELDEQSHVLKEALLGSDLAFLESSGEFLGDIFFVGVMCDRAEVKNLRIACEAVAAHRNAVILVLCTSNGKSAAIFVRSKGNGVDLGKYMRGLTLQTGATGGGNAVLAQCSSDTDISRAFVSTAEKIKNEIAENLPKI